MDLAEPIFRNRLCFFLKYAHADACIIARAFSQDYSPNDGIASIASSVRPPSKLPKQLGTHSQSLQATTGIVFPDLWVGALQSDSIA